MSRAGRDGTGADGTIGGGTMPAVSVDLHSHTNHSPDASMSPAELVKRAREAGLDRIAVTDHDAIEGAFRARELAPETVIVGQEISCAGGVELIGLFLEEWVRPGGSVEEIADRIRAQGGVVYAPHPFAYLWRRDRRGRELVEASDVVEAVNARAFWPEWNRRARQIVGHGRRVPGRPVRRRARPPEDHVAAEPRGVAHAPRPALRHARPPGLEGAPGRRGPEVRRRGEGADGGRGGAGTGRLVLSPAGRSSAPAAPRARPRPSPRPSPVPATAPAAGPRWDRRWPDPPPRPRPPGRSGCR